MISNSIKIAVILTCHNRKDKTSSCLKSLFIALDNYNNKNNHSNVVLNIYLTDDGSTDGTATEIKKIFPDKSIQILQGNGNLYWAGGMRFAWNEALKKHNEWDFYLLLNDDTDLMIDLFSDLFSTHDYCLRNYKKEGIYSGITSSKSNPNKMTYGGDVWINKFLGLSKRLGESNFPQLCDMTNSNILLVPKIIIDNIGIFSNNYVHGIADYDYTIKARKNNIPVLITANFCGKCDNDHLEPTQIERKLIQMQLKERKLYFQNPLHSNKDYLKYILRTSPIRYPIVLLGRFLNIYFPKFYYWLHHKRV